MNFGYYPYQNNNPYQQQIAQIQAQQNNNTFIHVPSEEVARNYMVAPGNSATFINDNAPYCYTKTAGFSQFDAPIFRVFRLVEETNSGDQKSEQKQDPEPNKVSAEFLTEFEALKSRVEALEKKFNAPVVNQQNERKMKNEPSNKQH